MEPFAEKGIGDTLDVDTSLPFIQKNKVATVVAAEFMYQPAYSAVLGIIRNWNLIANKNTSFLTVKKYSSIIPSYIRSFLEGELPSK